MNLKSWQLQAERIQSDDVPTQGEHFGRVLGGFRVMWALPQSEVRSDDQVGNSRCLDRFGRRLSCFQMEEQVRDRRRQADIHHVAQFSRLVFQNLQIGTPFNEILPLLDSIG